MLKRYALLLCCLIVLLLAACSGKRKFDRDAWNAGDGLTFPSRDAMVDDLLKTYKLKGLKYQEVIHLLHRPQISSQKEMIYEIDGTNIPGKPRYIKNLVISLKDSVVTDAKIYERRDKKK